MAVTILYTVERSSDFRQITVSDNGTAWTTGGDMDKANVTGITLSLFGTDKETPLKIITFTTQERTDFLAGNGVVFLFSDSRLFGTVYAPDNFYTSQIGVSGGAVVNTQVCFTSWFYMKKIVNNSFANVSIPLSTFFEANKEVTGNLAALTTLEYLDSSISAAREIEWRKEYSFLSWNYNL